MNGLTPEQLAQIDKVVREAVREEAPKVIRAELNAAGLRLDGAQDQDEARRDFMFLRDVRRAVNSASSKIGYAVLMTIVGGIMWLVMTGVEVWRRGTNL